MADLAKANPLSLALHYELVRPGGEVVSHEGFPALEEARVLGGEALEPRHYGAAVGLELKFASPKRFLKKLEQARKDGAHNAGLRVRLGVDALSPDGRVLPTVARTITYGGEP